MNGSGSSARSTGPTRLEPASQTGLRRHSTNAGAWSGREPARHAGVPRPPAAPNWVHHGGASRRRCRRAAGRAADAPLPRDATVGMIVLEDVGGTRRRSPRHLQARLERLGVYRREVRVRGFRTAHGFWPSSLDREGDPPIPPPLFDSCRPVGSRPFFPRTNWEPRYDALETAALGGSQTHGS